MQLDASVFWISCRHCIWVELRLRKRELQMCLLRNYRGGKSGRNMVVLWWKEDIDGNVSGCRMLLSCMQYGVV